MTYVPIDAGALEDSYIKLFKAKDPRAARIFPYAEILCSVGKLTINDVAAYINDVLLDITEICHDLKRLFTMDFIIKILDNPNLAPDKTVSILRGKEFSPDEVQHILYTMVDEGYYDKLLEIMTYDAPDYSITANTSWTDGIKRVHNLSIDAGVTLSIDAPPGVIIADTITNNGSIVSGWVKGAGGSPGYPPGKGGDGKGGLIILARSINVGEIHADGEDGESGTTNGGNGGTAGNGGAGLFWEIDGYPAGIGGKGGSFGADTVGRGHKNGGGGGDAFGYNKGGDGGSADVVVFSTSRDLLNELFKCIVDWYIQNVLNKTPTNVKTIPELGGSGGGGGADYGNADSGGGGGGGGEIIIFGTNVTAGTVTAKGGNGGNGGTQGSYDSGGGGGGGGIIYVFYKSLTGTFTFDVSGGARGTGDYNGAAGSAGSAATFQV